MENVVDYSKLVEFYKGKKILITGHTGFKGAWLLAILSQFGAHLKGFALLPETKECIYNEIDGNTLCDSIIGDINKIELVEKEVLSFKPDLVFHLAAQALVIDSYLDPLNTYQTNVLGTLNLLETCRKLNNLCTVVVVTTDKVYRNLEDGSYFKEEDPLGGHDPYSTSKACVELLCQSYRKSYFNSKGSNPQIKLVTARAGNVIGGGDYSKNRLIPDLVRSINEKKALNIRHSSSIRPWQHVLEPLAGYLILGAKEHLNKEDLYDSFNFGPNTESHIKVKEMIENIIKYWGEGSFIANDQINFHEANILKLDIKRSNVYLKWQSQFTIDDAIRYTVDWYKSENKREITYKQIKNYFFTRDEITN